MEQPIFFDKQYAGRSMNWSGSDQIEQYQYNLKNNKELLEEFGWIDSEIEYSYNTHGFRDDDFSGGKCGIAFGCSFTSGVGLHKEQTWSHKLSNLLNYKVWNLGVGGESLDTIFRLVEYYVPYLKPEFICILLPNETRFEIFDYRDDTMKTIMPSDYEGYDKDCIMSFINDTAVQLNQRKNLHAIQHICYENNTKVYYKSSSEFNPGDVFLGWARDIQHFGETYQNLVAKYFYEKVNE